MSINLTDFKPTEKTVGFALEPSDEARAYMNPVEDDTWVRRAEFVRMDQLRSVGNDDTAAKRALMKEFAANPYNTTTTTTIADSTSSTLTTTAGTGRVSEEAAVMEGMAWQEKFLHEYKKQSASDDKNKALSYRQQMIEKFRRKNGAAS